MPKRSTVPLHRRSERKQRLTRDDHESRQNREHGRARKRASRPARRRPQQPRLGLWCPRGPEDREPVGGVERDAEDERAVERHATDGPALQCGLDVLVVELGRAQGRDGRRGVGGCEAVREDVDGEEEERGGVTCRGKRAGERAGRTGRGEDALEERARGVYQQRREDEIALPEYGLVVLAPKHLRVITGGFACVSEVSEGARVQGVDYEPELTMVLDEAAEPPRLAAVGAARWTNRNVVMNGADP